MTIDIFDHLGALRTEFTAAEIASLDDEKVVRLEAVIVAGRSFKDAEAALVSANLAVKEAMAEVDKAKAGKAIIHPPMTQHMAWLRDVKGVTE